MSRGYRNQDFFSAAPDDGDQQVLDEVREDELLQLDHSQLGAQLAVSVLLDAAQDEVQEEVDQRDVVGLPFALRLHRHLLADLDRHLVCEYRAR